MCLNDGFDDGKPQSGTISIALTRWVDAVEAVEQSGEVFCRYFYAWVLDGNSGFTHVHGQRYQHGPALGGVPDGVRYEVAERALQHQPVAGDGS